MSDQGIDDLVDSEAESDMEGIEEEEENSDEEWHTHGTPNDTRTRRRAHEGSRVDDARDAERQLRSDSGSDNEANGMQSGQGGPGRNSHEGEQERHIAATPRRAGTQVTEASTGARTAVRSEHLGCIEAARGGAPPNPPEACKPKPDRRRFVEALG